MEGVGYSLAVGEVALKTLTRRYKRLILIGNTKQDFSKNLSGTWENVELITWLGFS